MVIVAPVVKAQRQSSGRKHVARLSASKPSVYISFLRFGKRKPSRTGESDERVWLRLHNNTRWPLVLNAQGASGHVFALAKEEEIGLFVSVEEVPEPRLRMIRDISPSDIPPVLPESLREPVVVNGQPSTSPVEEKRNCQSAYVDSCHVCSIIKLAPGRSFVFSVPREFLCTNLKIYIVYNYDWERMSGEPEHRAYFYGSALPKLAR
jgi:hypothetical protein